LPAAVLRGTPGFNAHAGALDMQIDFTPSREVFPFESRWFEADGIRMYYVDEGTGRPILMCHGNPTWSFLYRKVILALRGRFRCVAVDYPGFGLSDRPERYGFTPAEHAELVGKLVDHLQVDGFIVMGQDWGGPIGTWVAAERADRLHGLVFMNTWFWPADRPLLQIFSRVMSSPPLQWAILKRNLFVEAIVPGCCVAAVRVSVGTIGLFGPHLDPLRSRALPAQSSGQRIARAAASRSLTRDARPMGVHMFYFGVEISRRPAAGNQQDRSCADAHRQSEPAFSLCRDYNWL